MSAKGKGTNARFLTNFKDLNESLNEYKNIIFKIYTLDSIIEKRISDILTGLLGKFERLDLKNPSFTILRELIVNGLKANSKRILFQQKNLDINNPDHYKEGIRSFRDELSANKEELISLCEKNNLFVQVSINYKQDYIGFSVLNNTRISATELDRMREKIREANKYNDMSEAVEYMIDFSEGAGLGIPMIVFMLKNFGASGKNLSISGNEQYTNVQVSLPKSMTRQGLSHSLAKQIISEVQELPAFPENITRLQRMINDGNTSIAEIARNVTQDPSLTADVLRIANSAGYATYKRIDTIDDALKIIGLKSFSGILVATATHTVLQKKYRKALNEVWDHSLRASFYALKLSVSLGLKENKDKAYICGLLHDLGKIVLFYLHSDTLKKIDKNFEKSLHRGGIIEDIAFGISHSEIGGLIAEHWNFESQLVEAIRLHHSPLESSEENRKIVYITYLANALLDIERGYGDYPNIESSVLEEFDLSLESVEKMAAKIRSHFDQE